MQSEIIFLPNSGIVAQNHHNLADHLQKSEIFRDYQKAFQTTTGLPLAIRAAGSFQAPMHGSKHSNPFCAHMAARNKTCSSCLQLQQRMETNAHDGATTLECIAGLSDSSVPVRVGERVIAFLQTGQVLLHQPSAARFKKIATVLAGMGLDSELPQVKEAYFNTRVMTRHQYDSILRLLSIFAQHLSAVSNQLMVQEAAAEAPAVAKARAFIADHQGEEISLAAVAQAANMSAFYFCKIFKKSTGLTFTEYLARVRVEIVKQLLLNPHKRVSEAAYEAGFQSLSQFNRVFRRIAGEAPSTYREKLHGSSGAAQVGAGNLTHAA
ncbi:MAG: helix-turn-helix domain-containing protein [Opitutaceae bacterium]|jgi:AraC-like DNA-binding protein/ligand-binding sensor protein